MGARGAHAWHADGDDLGVDGAELVVVQAPRGQDVRCEVVYDDVADGDEAARDLLRLGPLHIEGDGELVGVEVGEADAGVDAVCSRPGQGCVPPGGVGAGAAGLDLDHLGAVGGQDLGAERPGDNPGEVQHADPCEGEGGGGHAPAARLLRYTVRSMLPGECSYWARRAPASPRNWVPWLTTWRIRCHTACS